MRNKIKHNKKLIKILMDPMVSSKCIENDQNNVVILTVVDESKETRATHNDVVSRIDPNNVIPRTLKVARKKHHNIILVESNNVNSVLMGQIQTASIQVESPTHFAEARSLINN